MEEGLQTPVGGFREPEQLHAGRNRLGAVYAQQIEQERIYKEEENKRQALATAQIPLEMYEAESVVAFLQSPGWNWSLLKPLDDSKLQGYVDWVIETDPMTGKKVRWPIWVEPRTGKRTRLPLGSQAGGPETTPTPGEPGYFTTDEFGRRWRRKGEKGWELDEEEKEDTEKIQAKWINYHREGALYDRKKGAAFKEIWAARTDLSAKLRQVEQAVADAEEKVKTEEGKVDPSVIEAGYESKALTAARVALSKVEAERDKTKADLDAAWRRDWKIEAGKPPKRPVEAEPEEYGEQPRPSEQRQPQPTQQGYQGGPLLDVDKAGGFARKRYDRAMEKDPSTASQVVYDELIGLRFPPDSAAVIMQFENIPLPEGVQGQLQPPAATAPQTGQPTTPAQPPPAAGGVPAAVPMPSGGKPWQAPKLILTVDDGAGNKTELTIPDDIAKVAGRERMG
ncbi:MAG: hypothetical protein ACYTG0_37780 [Planctomycetota bacterium]|jgi:hypothetical protein